MSGRIKNKNERKQFVIGRVDSLYYHLHRISFNRAGSYIDSPEWVKAKGVTINPKNINNKCFKYAITVALNHEKRFEQTHKEYHELILLSILLIGKI